MCWTCMNSLSRPTGLPYNQPACLPALPARWRPLRMASSTLRTLRTLRKEVTVPAQQVASVRSVGRAWVDMAGDRTTPPVVLEILE